MFFFLLLVSFCLCVSGQRNRERSSPTRALSSEEIRRDHEKRNCSVCSDGGDCCGAEQCCGGSKNSSSVCCGFGTGCCDGECCESDETCCPDKIHGSICCVAMETQCCPATQLMARFFFASFVKHRKCLSNFFFFFFFF
jgi:hypothetical protein